MGRHGRLSQHSSPSHFTDGSFFPCVFLQDEMGDYIKEPELLQLLQKML